MAGSYKHVVDDNNNFIGVDLLDNLGDAHEALEECYWMIKYLTGGDKEKIFEIQKAYIAAVDGCDNPDYAKTMTYEKYWNDD